MRVVFGRLVSPEGDLCKGCLIRAIFVRVVSRDDDLCEGDIS